MPRAFEQKEFSIAELARVGVIIARFNRYGRRIKPNRQKKQTISTIIRKCFHYLIVLVFKAWLKAWSRHDDIKFPVYSLAVGDTVVKPDVRINDIAFNSLVYLNENIPLEVNFSAVGVKNQNVLLNLFKQHHKKLIKKKLLL